MQADAPWHAAVKWRKRQFDAASWSDSLAFAELGGPVSI